MSDPTSLPGGAAPTRSSGPADPVLANAPHRIGRVSLKVRDLDRVGGFYRDVIGLEVVAEAPRRLELGAASSVLLVLQEDPLARQSSPREAGLFHTAFLLPTRADLAAWVAFARERATPLQGASDHLVSEALYLADPEGNGIEIYVDRPSAEWPRMNGGVEMATNPLDFDDLARAGEGHRWAGFPTGGVIGHVHLQVGELAPADAFYGDVLGFEIMCRYPGASFFGSGGYHHQLAANIWNSRGAPARSEDATGLADVEILVAPHVLEAARSRLGLSMQDAGHAPAATVSDPWGTSITLVAR